MSLMCPGGQKIMKAFPLYVSQRHSSKKARVARDSSIVAHHEHFPLGGRLEQGQTNSNRRSLRTSLLGSRGSRGHNKRARYSRLRPLYLACYQS
jgi:hypothetical protein